MSLIPDDVIEQVRDAADIVGIVGEHVELKRAGADWRGPCPFHGGTHRNFAVIPKKGMFYCFVCHEAGDVFTFMMKRLGMDYPTAVREITRTEMPSPPWNRISDTPRVNTSCAPRPSTGLSTRSVTDGPTTIPAASSTTISGRRRSAG